MLLAAALLGGCDSSPTAPPPLPPLPAPAPAPPASPMPEPPLPAPANASPSLVLRIKPDPPEGDAPLVVTFNLCRSVDPDGDRMLFAFDFDDGATDQGSCRAEHVYDRPGRYHAALCVWDHRPGHAVCEEQRVIVRAPPAPEDDEE